MPLRSNANRTRWLRPEGLNTYRGIAIRMSDDTSHVTRASRQKSSLRHGQIFTNLPCDTRRLLKGRRGSPLAIAAPRSCDPWPVRPWLYLKNLLYHTGRFTHFLRVWELHKGRQHCLALSQCLSDRFQPLICHTLVAMDPNLLLEKATWRRPPADGADDARTAVGSALTE